MLSSCVMGILEGEGLSVDEFRELCLRLLNNGVLCRAENQVEQQLYDRFLRIEDLVKDYLQLMGVQLFHDRRFAYVRLYPPGANVPGMEDSEANAFGGGLRARLRQDEVALLLVLRLQYDKALREGQLDDAGFVTESLESISIAMRNLLNRSLPDKLTERRQVFQRLRQLRLIEFRQEDSIDSAESWIRIHPMIVSFVNDDALDALDQSLPQEEGEAADVS
ncbi:MAG: DUF4194 domain-containing protein [Gammaproteobacteria bacterium]|nr:DUF4194 domain-containing protein [Gammaproteobacteria bacterium]